MVNYVKPGDAVKKPFPVTIVKCDSDGSVIFSPLSGNGKPIIKVYPLVCDRLSITCDFPAPIREHVLNNFIQEKGYPSKGYGKTVKLTHIDMKHPPYCHSEALLKTFVLAQCDPKNPDKSFLRLEWTPSKVKCNKELKSQLDNILFDAEGYGMDYILQHGKVTRIDFALDIAYEKLNRFLFCYPNMQLITKIHSKSGQSEYIGGNLSSEKRIVIYDRIPAIKYKNNKIWFAEFKEPVPKIDILRIEFKLCPSTSLDEVASIKNPFAGLTVASAQNATPDDPLWNMFIALARFEGANCALSRLPKYQKKKYKARLHDCRVQWYKPNFAWKQVPAIIKQLKELI